ncbi:Nitroreductase [Streptomyces sp. MnatMP-M77]|nr:Nitroreductase [Streptomyces sp. MnatMP-M77]
MRLAPSAGASRLAVSRGCPHIVHRSRLSKQGHIRQLRRTQGVLQAGSVGNTTPPIQRGLHHRPPWSRAAADRIDRPKNSTVARHGSEVRNRIPCCLLRLLKAVERCCRRSRGRPDVDVYEAVDSRRAVRAFSDEPVSKEILECVLAAATRAPSSGNLQPWHVYVVTGEPLAELKRCATARARAGDPGDEREYPMYPAELTSPYEDRFSTAAAQRYEALGIERADPERPREPPRRRPRGHLPPLSGSDHAVSRCPSAAVPPPRSEICGRRRPVRRLAGRRPDDARTGRLPVERGRPVPGSAASALTQVPPGVGGSVNVHGRDVAPLTVVEQRPVPDVVPAGMVVAGAPADEPTEARGQGASDP